MHIKRLTLTLPSRFRNDADSQARLIAQAIAERLGEDTPSRLRIELNDNGSSHRALADAVGTRLGTSAGFPHANQKGRGKS
ncbi:MAG: hypothetical protein WBN06_06615 [Lysobacterales bacterium]